MLSLRKVIPVLLVAFVLSIVFAETIPAGKYDCYGRVVKRADGSHSVFFGGGCYEFPKKISDSLAPYVGKFVKVDYTRISEEQAGYISMAGSSIGSIDKVTVISNNCVGLPVAITAIPAKGSFNFSEPVRVNVIIINLSDTNKSMFLSGGQTSLCRDYKGRYSLEPEGHYNDKTPYGFDGSSRQISLDPGKSIEFEVISSRMAEPGACQLVYSISVSGHKLRMQSRVEYISIRKPENEKKEHLALKKWLKNATLGQRIEIADRLRGFGDNSGTDEILRLLEENQYSKDRYCNGNAFRYAWRYGGSKGEKIMLSLIKRQTKHDYVNRMIESVNESDNRIELLKDLLSSNNLTRRDISGWTDKPRVCDITANWLVGYTGGKMNFPKEGSIKQRDRAVVSVLKKLKSKPEFFKVLSRKKSDDKKYKPFTAVGGDVSKEQIFTSFPLEPFVSPASLIKENPDGTFLVKIKPQVYMTMDQDLSYNEMGHEMTSFSKNIFFRIDSKSYYLSLGSTADRVRPPSLDRRKQYTFLIKPLGRADSTQRSANYRVLKISDGEKVIFSRIAPRAN